MSVTQITDDNIDTGIDASKCIGAIGAMDGSALTGLNVGTSLLKNASDPAVDTNPADGVGAIWINTSTGQMFSCTDATTDQNTWMNMGTGTGHITYVPYYYQGTQYGYNSNGYQNNVAVDSYERYSYPSGTPSNIVGNLTSAIVRGTGHSSATHGYQAGWGTQIFKFSFATNGNASLVGSMSVYHESGGGASSEDNGYHMGGYAPGNAVSMIEKFNFAADTVYGNIGSLTVHRYNITGHSSPTHGYATGGPHPTPVTIIDRVAFANDTVAVHVGNLSKAVYGVWADHSSLTHGFATGMSLSPTVTHIEKFAFAASSNSSDVADLSALTDSAVGTSETNNGYTSGGSDTGANKWTKIDKFSFASTTTATNVGNLAITRIAGSGQQV